MEDLLTLSTKCGNSVEIFPQHFHRPEKSWIPKRLKPLQLLTHCFITVDRDHASPVPKFVFILSFLDRFWFPPIFYRSKNTVSTSQQARTHWCETRRKIAHPVAPYMNRRFNATISLKMFSQDFRSSQLLVEIDFHNISTKFPHFSTTFPHFCGNSSTKVWKCCGNAVEKCGNRFPQEVGSF